MAKIRQSNLDNSIVTGLTELSEGRADGDFAIIYDSSTGTLKKIQASNLGVIAPVVSSVSPTNVLTGDGTGNATFTITGSNFAVGSTAVLVTDGGAEVSFDTVTRDSSTQITAVIAISSLSNANEPYDVKVTSNSLSNTLANQINIDAQPIFNTASGSLGSNRFSFSGVEVNATDPDSAGNVTFEIQSGALPPGISLTNTGANGGTATFTGTISPLASSDTVYNFTLRAVDAASNTSSRAFSLTASGPVTESFTSSGTFSAPSGVSSVDVLVVAGGGGGNVDFGGGGGAGGLIFIPGYPVTPGGTVSVTVGCGGAGSPAFNTRGLTGQDSVFGTLTAKGGGGGGANATSKCGDQGGSGGGGNGHGNYPSPGTGNATGGPGIQPTQPGQSGAYGFGNPGGDGWFPGNPTVYIAGSGGGAGAAGGPGNGPQTGGIGKAYTIADGTTPVYYAGGGGGHIYNTSPTTIQNGGQGGGGGGTGGPTVSPATNGQGQANKGGGAGGGAAVPAAAITGGKGIVIVRY